MFATSAALLHVAASEEDAVARLAEAFGEGVALAGGTWLMRAPVRGEGAARIYVDISRVASLRRIEVLEREVIIGAMSTHSDIAAGLVGHSGCAGLVAAASKSANPAIRNMATLGGNLSCTGFAASDLIPALLCLDAEVEMLTPDGPGRLSLAAYLRTRETLPPGSLLTRVRFSRRQLRCSHQRLPLRKAGDYPVAIVSVTLSSGDSDSPGELRFAVGSVDAVATRWDRLESLAQGQSLRPDLIGSLAEQAVDQFEGRDGVEAQGWYRKQVLPTLVRRALRELAAV